MKTGLGASGKTLFMTVSNRAALLVTSTAGRRRKRRLQFANEHAALDWCLAKQATFLLTPAGTPDPAAN